MGGARRFLAQLSMDADEGAIDSVLLIVAHPDDEVVGAGGQLSRFRQPFFIHVTDGAPRDMRDARAAGFATREAYAAARRAELTAALAAAGIGPEQTTAIGLADQEASLKLVDLSRRLASEIRDRRPVVVITHAYEGGHPDHDATAFAVHAACGLLEAEAEAAPAIIEMACYHNRSGRIATFEFLPESDGETTTVVLSRTMRELKRRMIARFTTQRATLSQFPVKLERFRPAPRYDFTTPPHDGTLFYELFPWGMTGPRWRTLAREALDALGITRPL